MNIENRNIRFTSTVICRIFLGIYLKICWWERIRFLRERRQGGKMSRKNSLILSFPDTDTSEERVIFLGLYRTKA